MADIVRDAAMKYRNWGKWGPDDELGTLNYITPEIIVKATRLVKRGVNFSLSIPFDSTGPQINQPRRFNPIHRMILTGPDFTTGAFTRPGGVGFADDMVIMALQCATQWDALSHCFLDGKLYNGYDANLVGSQGAKKNGIHKMAGHIVTRGGRHRYLGHGGPSQRDPRHLPAPAPDLHPEHGAAGRRDLRPRGARRGLCRGRRLRVPVRGAAHPDHGRRRLPRQPVRRQVGR